MPIYYSKFARDNKRFFVVEAVCWTSMIMMAEGEGPPSKFRKLQGAATYRHKYNSDWKKEFPFIDSVKGDLFR